MLSPLKKENVTIRLRNILKENEIKLWLPPYFNESDGNTENLTDFSNLQELASKYCNILNVTPEQCAQILVELQKKSFQGIKERDQFKADGLATIRVKVSGQHTSEFSVQLKLLDTVEILKQNISQKIELPIDRLKLISNGKILRNEYTLQAQQVKHGSVVLVLLLHHKEGEDVLSETQNNHKIIQETKDDIEFLTNMNTEDKEYLSITNQSGFNLNLPTLERNILVTAMALHEKGRTAFKRGQYSLALVFFLEADSEFKTCNADVLNKVDNYGLLNLDILWTYLHLQSLQYLNDAEARLKICEESFLRSYGSNMERLNSIKGSSENERILFVRLHLLQGILCHIVNKKEEAIRILKDVEYQIQSLKVDTEKLKTLRTLGYSTKEARLGLRAAFNDLNAAVEYILKCRKEREIVDNFEKIRKFVDHHTCINGSQVNLTVLAQLHDMGYTRLIGTQALVACNNEINSALIWIHDFISRLTNQYPPYVIDVLTSLEFDDKGVQLILDKYKYKLNDFCIQELLSTTSIGREYLIKLLAENKDFCKVSLAGGTGEAVSAALAMLDLPSTSTSSGNIAVENSFKSKDKELEALMRLQDGISNSEDDYLNVNLKSEEKFLELYKSFLV